MLFTIGLSMLVLLLLVTIFVLVNRFRKIIMKKDRSIVRYLQEQDRLVNELNKVVMERDLLGKVFEKL